eukprot:3294883-Karenia_brevis.AAC.1
MLLQSEQALKCARHLTFAWAVKCALLLAMPFIPLEAEVQAKALEKGKAGLKWVVSDNEGSEEVQATLFEMGFCKLSTFLGLGETRAEVRETLRTEFNVDVAD